MRPLSIPSEVVLFSQQFLTHCTMVGMKPMADWTHRIGRRYLGVPEPISAQVERHNRSKQMSLANQSIISQIQLAVSHCIGINAGDNHRCK
eukprot:1351443-Amphidinium_carterae.1